MEFKPNNDTTRYARQQRLVVPQRAGTPSRPNLSQPQKPAKSSLFGDDDKIINDDELEDVRFRDIIGAWIKQAISHSPLEKKFEEGQQKKQRLNEMKKDLKWALMADLDAPVKPTKKQLPPAHHVDSAPSTHHPANGHTSHQPAHGHTSNSIDININFGSLPKLPRLKKLPTLSDIIKFIKSIKWTKQRVAILLVVLTASLGVITWNLVPGLGGASSHSVDSLTEALQPDYSTVVPKGKSIDSLGGWHRVSPPSSNPVFAYADKIDGVAIIVSQQPIPDSFQPDIDKHVAELAKSYVATDKITTGAVTIYVGTSASGPQSAILIKNNVLVLVKSSQKISDDSWAAYANTLD